MKQVSDSMLFERFPLFIYSVTIYLLVAGAAYVFGFWALFPINIFDFMGVIDIAKSSLPNIMFSFGIVSTQLIAHLFINGYTSEIVQVKHGKITEFLVRHVKVVYFLFMLSFCGPFVFISERPDVVIKHHGAMVFILWSTVLLAALLTYSYMVFKGFVEHLNAKRYLINLVVITLVVLTFSSFAIGFTKAINIISGVRFSYISQATEQNEEQILKQNRYLGFYGGKYFLWNPLSGEVITTDSSGTLSIKEFRKLP